MNDPFDKAWSVVKMPIGWPCSNCGYHNLREGTKAGQQVIFDVCDECGKGPRDMPTFVDDQEHGEPQKNLLPESKEFQEDKA